MVRVVEFASVVEAVSQLCIKACHLLPDDVIDALKSAACRESNPRARWVLERLLENARIAAGQMVPLCQDTGLAIVFVELGSHVVVADATRPDLTIIDAVQEGIRKGYQDGLLRKSVVADPLYKRQNTGTNTPGIVHLSVVPGDKIAIRLMAKGAGCENKSQFRIFEPTAPCQQVKDWIVSVAASAGADACPPLIVGVGIGGNLEHSCLLAKKALLRPLDSHNQQPFYAQMEQELLGAINATGLGPQGMGGDTTALGVLIETAPCHIASLPVAVNIECHSHRHACCII